VTASQIIEQVFEDKLNFPKINAQLVRRYVEENKDKESSPQI